MTARQEIADFYVNELVTNYGATIEGYKTLIDNHNTGSLIVGSLQRGEGVAIKFASYITLTDSGQAVVARIMAPDNGQFTDEDLMKMVEGVTHSAQRPFEWRYGYTVSVCKSFCLGSHTVIL